ncbi:MAG: NifU family protein, partial [Campylobacterota bacterium]|nr:NifU family protein [Campylobacterota bacterium]
MIQMGGVDKPINTDCELNNEFRVKSYDEQKEIVEDTINRFIRPILVKDGGDIMILDFLSATTMEFRLAYQGACAGCSLGATSTYDLIKNTLSQVIDENIRIYII